MHAHDGAPAVVLAVVCAVAAAAVAPAGLLALVVAPASPLVLSLRRHLELPLGRLQSADIYQKEYVRQSHPFGLVPYTPLAMPPRSKQKTAVLQLRQTGLRILNAPLSL